MLNYFVSLSLALLIVSPIYAQQDQESSDFKMQGEYSGSIEAGGEKRKLGIQVIALGEGKFSAVGYLGGLPGDGWDGVKAMRDQDQQVKDGILMLFEGKGDTRIENGVASILDDDGSTLGELKRVVRKSKTLGAKPPKNAVVLFGSVDSKEKAVSEFGDLWRWKDKAPRISDDGLLKQGTASVQKFGDQHLHIEFRLPFQPTARGQQRGNSGVYLQGKYEVQMLDSFGLTGEQNECGGIYSIKKPDVNMCFPPMQWQTYDIEFHTAKFKAGKKIADAWISVLHNGTLIHDKVKLGKKTTAAPFGIDGEPGPVYLQDHGNEVRYRNIWVAPIESEEKKSDE